MLANIPKEIVEMQKKGMPVGPRVGTASEIAVVLSGLACSESGWISGHAFSCLPDAFDGFVEFD
jgi:hypothetical protein